MVVDLPEGVDLAARHGAPHASASPSRRSSASSTCTRTASPSVGIFVPSWFDSPVRTAYRYLQHFVQHPYLWRVAEGRPAALVGREVAPGVGPPRRAAARRRRLRPHRRGLRQHERAHRLRRRRGVGDRRACSRRRCWSCSSEGKPFTKENLERDLRRAGGARAGSSGRRGSPSSSRDGFQHGVVQGMLGMALAGLTKGALHLGPEPVAPHERISPPRSTTRAGSRRTTIARDPRSECAARRDVAARRADGRGGWPEIPLDGQLLVTHQDALLMGGKVQAPPGYADHVALRRPDALRALRRADLRRDVLRRRRSRPGEGGGARVRPREVRPLRRVPVELHAAGRPGSERTNLEFRAGAGGLHSARELAAHRGGRDERIPDRRLRRASCPTRCRRSSR